MQLPDRLRKIHLGSVLGVVVALYIAFYLIQTVHRNYTYQTQIGQLQTQISTLESDKQSLEYKIQYYQTDSYKEKQARAKLGLQDPGEGVVILPHKDDATQNAQQKKTPPKKSHWQQWIEFLQGKQA